MKTLIQTIVTSALLVSCFSCALIESRPDPYAGLRPADRRIAMAMDRRDLVLGMSRNHVRSIWGSPLEVETAGDDESGNERWIYSDRLMNPAFREFGQQRVVYFEQGRVVGWDQQ